MGLAAFERASARPKPALGNEVHEPVPQQIPKLGTKPDVTRIEETDTVLQAVFDLAMNVQRRAMMKNPSFVVAIGISTLVPLRARGAEPPGPLTSITNTIVAPLAGRMYTVPWSGRPQFGYPAIDFYGGDMGLTYKHRGQLRVLFNDVWVDFTGTPLNTPSGGYSTSSDCAGIICLATDASGVCSGDAPTFPNWAMAQWYAHFNAYGWYNYANQTAALATPSYATNIAWHKAGPPVNFFKVSFNHLQSYTVNDHGTIMSMGAGQVAVAGFSNWPSSTTPPAAFPYQGKPGSFVVFARNQFITCHSDDDCQQTNFGQTSPPTPTPLPFKCDLSVGTRPFPGFPGTFQACISTPIANQSNPFLQNPPIAIDGQGNFGNDLGCSPQTTGSPPVPVGVCVDTGSSIRGPDNPATHTPSNEGRRWSTVQVLEVGNAYIDGSGVEHEMEFRSVPWRTNRFMNPVVRTVEKFEPSNPANHDYTPANDSTAAQASNGLEKVFVWGRPGFIGNRRKGRKLSLYFGYSDMPGYGDVGPRSTQASPGAWLMHYFTGTDATGKPLFSFTELEAAPLSVPATDDDVDWVGEATVSWVPAINRWVMFYGGEVLGGAGPNGNHGLLPAGFGVEDGTYPGESQKNFDALAVEPDGSIMIRTALNPWGPWSAKQKLFPKDGSESFTNLNGFQDPRHDPNCGAFYTQDKCVAQENTTPPDPVTVGSYYSPSIIDPWTVADNSGGVDIAWNVSTFDPYQVVLMHTNIHP